MQPWQGQDAFVRGKAMGEARAKGFHEGSEKNAQSLLRGDRRAKVRCSIACALWTNYSAVLCKMAASHVVKCRSFCFTIDVNRVYTITRIFSDEKINKLARFPHCRYLFTGKDEVRWSSGKELPGRTCQNTSSHAVGKDSRSNEVTVEYYRGLPQITVPLPSRKKRCRFTLRPISNTVGDFITMLNNEDHGIDYVSVSTPDGIRIASSNTIEALMEDDFRLVINDVCYHVKTPKQEKLSKEELERLSDVKNLVHQLYEALNVEEHQLKKERELCEQLEDLKLELEPMEEKLQELHKSAEKQTNVLTWVGLGLMSVQFGILARLTWWEYSWDIMEPVTYFVTYGTAMAAYAYYVLTKQEYILPDVRDRQYLITLHKKARKIGLDLDKYNKIKENIYNIERDLRRLRDPLQVHLPPHHLADSLKKSQNPFARALGMFQKKSPKVRATESIREERKDSS